MKPQHVDVLVVGAGLSGIAAAYYLKERCPGRTFTILEARDDLGGTWDLFKYPGIRSDSDMYTLGFSFHPWKAGEAIADGPAILSYLHETAETYGIKPHIQFGTRMMRADWSSSTSTWTVETLQGDTKSLITCNFLWGCTGYYRYDRGFTPDFPGMARFKGEIVHPQLWDERIDYKGKRVIVIGSGATAVTLVPEMSHEAAHVTMLQRSPSYILSRPREDPIANRLKALLPEKTAHHVSRWKNLLLSMLLYNLGQRAPEWSRRFYMDQVREALGDSVDVDLHFNPSYKPWDQRLCLIPEGDLFEALKAGRASMVTDHVEEFTAEGVRLRSGRVLEADLVVTATGLELQVLGGTDLRVDGEPVQFGSRMMYKGTMFSDVPNLAVSLGYTNASWTLKCELICDYVCRLLNHMDDHGYASCQAAHDPTMKEMPLLDLNSNYIKRAERRLPAQGERVPWRLYQNYPLDIAMLRHGPIEDDVLTFQRRSPRG